MAAGEGSVTFNFGTGSGTNITTATISDANIVTGTRIEIYLLGTDSTSDHNAYEHSILQLGGFQATAITINSGVGFTAQAATTLRLTGQVKCRYVYSA